MNGRISPPFSIYLERSVHYNQELVQFDVLPQPPKYFLWALFICCHLSPLFATAIFHPQTKHQHITELQNKQRSLPDVPILSYRRPKNLWGILVRARIKPDTPSNPTGSYKCHSQRNCITCQHITDSTTSFNFTNTDKNYDIKQRLD